MGGGGVGGGGGWGGGEQKKRFYDHIDILSNQTTPQNVVSLTLYIVASLLPPKFQHLPSNDPSIFLLPLPFHLKGSLNAALLPSGGLFVVLRQYLLEKKME